MRLPIRLREVAGWRARRALTPLRRRRHRHLLRKSGASEADRRRQRSSWWGQEPRWYDGGTPPRRHNHVTALVDGDSFFPALCEALEGAQHYVYVIGWSLTPHMPLLRRSARQLVTSQVRAVLQETSTRVPVRVLLWAGARLLFKPTMDMARDAQHMLEEGASDLQCRLDDSAHPSHCHHQKAIVVDGQVAFVGGMDLTTLAGDRWDTSHHPLRAGRNWHDVQLRIEGEAVADVERNFRQRWQAVTGEESASESPRLDPSWDTPVQILRTIPRRVYDFAPQGEFGIYHGLIGLIRRARQFIYLENQYLWAPEILDALIAVMQRPNAQAMRIIVLLPANAYDGKWDNDQHVERLREVDGGRGIVEVYCPYASGPTTGVTPFSYRPVYVHAKVTIVDDEWFAVGSANLNDRGMFTDSEIVALVHEPELARSLRVELWAEHLALRADRIAAADPCVLADTEWRQRAAENAAIVKAADRPLTSQIHRYECGHMPGSWLLEEAEALTVEH